MSDSEPTWVEASSHPPATAQWNYNGTEEILPVVEAPIPTLISLLTRRQCKFVQKRIRRRLPKCTTSFQRVELRELDDLLQLRRWRPRKR